MACHPRQHSRVVCFCLMTDVTAPRGFFCYTAINAFATVCSSRGDPVGSDTLPPSPARRLVPAPISMRAACELSKTTAFEKLTLSPSRKKTIE